MGTLAKYRISKQMLVNLLLLLSTVIGVGAQSKVTIVLTSTSNPPTVTITHSVIVVTGSLTTSTTTIPIIATITPDNSTISYPTQPPASANSPSTTLSVPTSVGPSSSTLSTQLVSATAAAATENTTAPAKHNWQVIGGLIGGTGGAFLAIVLLVVWGCRHHKKEQAKKLQQQTPSATSENTALPTSLEPPTLGSWAPPPPGSSLWRKVNAASYIGSATTSTRIPKPPLPARNTARVSSNLAQHVGSRDRYSVRDSVASSVLSETVELAPWRQSPANQEGNRDAIPALMNGNRPITGGQPTDKIECREDSNPPSIQYGISTASTGKDITQYKEAALQPITVDRNSAAASSFDWKDNTSTYTTDWTDTGRYRHGSPEPNQFARSAADSGKFLHHGSPASTRSPATTVPYWPGDNESVLEREFQRSQAHDTLTGNSSSADVTTAQYGRRL